VNPRTPVIVGVGVASQRLDEPYQAKEPFELMAEACVRAAEDAGSSALISEASSIRVPRGFWNYKNPGRLVAEEIGANNPRSILAELGISQQTLISNACRAVAAGDEDIAIVTGGEAKYRSLRAKITGVEINDRLDLGLSPDVTMEPSEALFDDLEAETGLFLPVRAFALMDNAMRRADGISIDHHRDQIAELWSNFARVASDNPHAWNKTAPTFEEIRTPGPDNRALAFPYSKLHSSNWNVDQAAALIICSAEKAKSLGLPRSNWVFAVAATESNHVVELSRRANPERSHGAAIGGARVLELAGLGVDEVKHLDLYSCFPAATRIFARELGIDFKRQLTVTGGMAFAGGPLNNYVLQSTARMSEILRQDPGSAGLVTTVSGLLNKQGFAVWSSDDPDADFQWQNVSSEVDAKNHSLDLVGHYRGSATVVSYTVLYDQGDPCQTIALCDTDDGRRTLIVDHDRSLACQATEQELCGSRVKIGRDGRIE